MSQATIDFSLALINRTGAFGNGRDLIDHLDRSVNVRYWRYFPRRMPSGLIGKILGRLMVREIMHCRRNFGTWPRSPGNRYAPVLYLDPLYVLHGDLAHEDAVLCHDIGPISHPEFYDALTVAAYYRAYDVISNVAPTMMFVSQWTRDRFLERFPAAYRRCTVIPLYVPERLQQVDSAVPTAVSSPFILMVGGLEKRKNYHRALDAFLALQRDDARLSFVIAGPRGNDADAIERRIADLTSVTYLGRVSDEQLVWLYRNCAAFLLPSLLEGFGIPALEAPLFGALPVLSTNTVFHEVVGDGAVFVEPTDPSAIAAGLHLALNMPAREKSQRLMRINQHASAYTFQRFIGEWRAAFDEWSSDAEVPEHNPRPMNAVLGS